MTHSGSRVFATHNDLPVHLRETMITLLNQQLADTIDLYSQVKQAHWNVKGMHFIQLHKLFDELAASLIDHVDAIAERVTALGGAALGTARMAAESSTLNEYPADLTAGKQVVEVIAQRYGAYASTSRAAIGAAAEKGDQDTADLFSEISRAVDKQLWFVEAHLQD